MEVKVNLVIYHDFPHKKPVFQKAKTYGRGQCVYIEYFSL